MILDTSAIVTVLREEVGSQRVADEMAVAPSIAVGAPTLVESAMVLTARLGLAGRTLLSRLMEEKDVAILSFTDQHWVAGFEAFHRFGKGRHPAALNFGDCLTYATARLAREPLLCIGDDFARTDLELVDLSTRPDGEAGGADE